VIACRQQPGTDGKELEMKKALITAMAVILALTAVSVAGCDDTSKAQEYMKAGDEATIKLEGYTKKAEDGLDEFLIELGVDLTASDTPAFETAVKAANEQIDSLIAEAEKGTAEYEKILELDGVDEYKKYAGLRIKALKNSVTVLQGLQDLLDQLVKASAAGKSLTEEMKTWTEQNSDVVAALAKAIAYWADAASYKSSNNL
jgi:DNA repair exonuclease SbcCD ATPase subunit